jgi:hypothetical protein
MDQPHSPTVVAKKDGSTHVWVEYPKMNAITKVDAYPLPHVNILPDFFSNNHYFSTLDLASGYWQIKTEGVSKEKTTFATKFWLYEFCVMPH